MNDFFLVKLISQIETYESILEHYVYNTNPHKSFIKCIIDYGVSHD